MYTVDGRMGFYTDSIYGNGSILWIYNFSPYQTFQSAFFIFQIQITRRLKYPPLHRPLMMMRWHLKLSSNVVALVPFSPLSTFAPPTRTNREATSSVRRHIRPPHLYSPPPPSHIEDHGVYAHPIHVSHPRAGVSACPRSQRGLLRRRSSRRWRQGGGGRHRKVHRGWQLEV